MLNKDRYVRIKTWLIRFVELQLFLSLISVPLLIAWGLPFSLMSIVGNLIFSPVLTFFLTLSSLLFITELVHIPNGLLVSCLESVVYVWHLVLSLARPSWLIGFVKLPVVLLCTIVLLALVIVSRRSWHAYTRIMSFLVVFVAVWVVSYMCHADAPVVHTLACNKGSVIIIHQSNKTVLIDPGYIAQRASAVSWVQYTLVPYLIQMTGSLSIDHVIVLQPSSRTFEALAGLCTKAQVHMVHVPWWHGTLPRSAWRTFFVFKELLTHNGGILKRFGTWPVTISLSDLSSIRLLPQQDTIAYHEASYNDTRVDCCIDKELLTFYAAKHVQPLEKKDLSV